MFSFSVILAINIFSLITSHDLGSIKDVDGKISEINVTMKNMHHEFTQWRQQDNTSKHIFIYSSVT